MTPCDTELGLDHVCAGSGGGCAEHRERGQRHQAGSDHSAANARETRRELTVEVSTLDRGGTLDRCRRACRRASLSRVDALLP